MNLVAIVALVAAGVVFGIVFPHRLTGIVSGATLYVFLPLLLFEAAWNLNYRAIRRFWRPIAVLAGPGVGITALVVAGALLVVRVPVATALLTGAILSATDPIAVVAVFRRLRVPHALSTIVECESLFNDAVAVLLYRLVLGGAVFAGVASSIGGIAFGIAAAFAAALLLRNRSSAVVQTVATFACAYGAYFTAERIGASGLFATIACGIGLRYYERSWVTLDIAHAVERAWDAGAAIANACVFFLVGAALDVRDAATHPGFIAAALAGAIAARYVVSWLLRPAGFPRAWLAVVRVAGLRGALSLALALALPVNTPYRDAVIATAFVVALATIVASALIVPRVARAAAR